MNEYYCVCSTYYRSGKATAAIVDWQVLYKKPESSCRELRDRDIYLDWFDSLEEAEEFARNA